MFLAIKNATIERFKETNNNANRTGTINKMMQTEQTQKK